MSLQNTCAKIEMRRLKRILKRAGSWGNSTRSGLNQKVAEIYRDAVMKLIDDSYNFLDRDYSLEHYE